MRAPLSGSWGANAVILAHTFNDMHLSALSILVPVLTLRHELSLTQAVGLATAFSSSALFLQPFFGLWLDGRGGARLAAASSLICGLALVALVLPLPFPVLLVIAALGGIGSAIFHPHGSALMAAAPGPRARLMGLFGSSGNLGIAFTPFILPPLVEAIGLEQAWVWFLLPGLVSFALLFGAGRAGLHYRRSGEASAETVPFRLATHVLAMMPLVLVVALRSWASNGLTTLLPLYVDQTGLGWVIGARQVSLMLLGGTIGSVAGGYLAQRYGARRVTIVSLALASVLFGLLLVVGGAATWLLVAAGGTALLTSFALLAYVAQEMLPSHRAYAASLSFGLGSGLGGLGLGLSGWLADEIGLFPALVVVALLPLGAALVALGLPPDRRSQPATVVSPAR